MHRKAQEGRLEQAESTVQRLEQEVKELESMIKKVGHDQDARYEKLRSLADGLLQIKREETDPRPSSRRSVTTYLRTSPTRTFGQGCTRRVPR